MTSPLRHAAGPDPGAQGPIRIPELTNTPASPNKVSDTSLNGEQIPGSPLSAVGSNLTAQSSFTDQSGSGSATPTIQRRKSKNLMGLKIMPSPRSSPLPSPKNSPFMKRKSSFSNISSALFGRKPSPAAGLAGDVSGCHGNEQASPQFDSPYTPDYVPDEQSGYFYDENASAHQSEDAYEEFIEEAKLLLAGVTPINPEDLELIKELGSGSAGVVELVRHTPSGVTMARKMVRLELRPSTRKQICTELKILHEVRSPYIVGFYGSYFTDREIAICMEYCDAGSLETLYRRAGSIPEDVLGLITKDVLTALSELRLNHKVLHRDIKPGNILMNLQGEVKLCDFGVSGELKNSLANSFVGTCSYMAPERLTGGQYSVHSDVWSLGLAIVEMAIGRFPMPPVADDHAGPPPRMSFFEQLEYIVNGPPLRLPARFSPEFQDFIALCLDKDPQARPKPNELVTHPWIALCQHKHVDVAAWLREALTRPVPPRDEY